MAVDQNIEKVEDLGEGDKGRAALWQAEIKSSLKYLEKFHKRAKSIEERYLDERGDNPSKQFKVNLFWSTMEVVLSMLYTKPPKPDAKRMFDDFNDEPSRVGGEILNRMLTLDVQRDGSTSHEAFADSTKDYAVVGMGQVWLRYDPEIESEWVEPVIDPVTGMEMVAGGLNEKIIDEEAPIEWVHWGDFLWSPARVWAEVRWVARRVYMTRDQLNSRFGEDIGKRVPMASKQSNNDKGRDARVDLPKDPWNRAEVYEIWDKTTKKVVWVNTGCDFILDERDDPLQLLNFFPCPRPLLATTSNSKLVPVSDFYMAQDQFEMLDEYNTRQVWLSRAMKAVGVYDRADDGVKRLMSEGVENELIPVDNWAMFAETGGIKGKIDWLPIDQVANTIDRLKSMQEGVKGQIYETLGISDIMRGNTKASETAAAQSIKAQFGSTRISLKQMLIANFVQQALTIKAEIIQRHFQPETIAKRSNIMLSPDGEFAQVAIQLLKTPEEAMYRVKVDVDSVTYTERSDEINNYNQMMTAASQTLQQVAPIVEKIPETAAPLLSMVKALVAKFKISEEVEGLFDKAIDSIISKSGQPKPADPMRDAEIEDKKAQALERKAGAVQRLADAEAKTVANMLPFPAPPEMFVGGMQGQPQAQMGAQGQQQTFMGGQSQQPTQHPQAPSNIAPSAPPAPQQLPPQKQQPAPIPFPMNGMPR